MADLWGVDRLEKFSTIILEGNGLSPKVIPNLDCYFIPNIPKALKALINAGPFTI